MISWHDPTLQVRSDPPRRRRYRALQSWYRETHLGVEPGRSASGRLVGSLLPDARSQEGLNFLDASIWTGAEARAEAVLAAGGTLEVDRLRRNLLSSMPLCFNLFGKLQTEPAAAARVLGVVLGLDIATVEEVLVEHAPVAAKALVGDRTAFDAFVTYTTATGASGFLGIETKYTEPFSPTTYPAHRYEPGPAFEAAGFHSGAAGRLSGAATNQLLRNSLLAAATRLTGGYDRGHVVVVAGQDDRAARRAVALVGAELAEPDELLRSVSLERLLEHCQLQEPLAQWAARFRGRYLDLSPIAEWFPARAATQPRQLAFDVQVGQLAAHCHATLGDLSRLPVPAGYPDSLALCTLDSIWSIGVRYGGVRGVIDRYRQHRRRLGANPAHDSLSELLATIDQVGSPDSFAELVHNRQRTASHGGIPKAAAVALAARALTGQGVDTARDLHEAIDAGHGEQLKRAWLAVPGQRSGVSWRYLLMLAGIPEVKPDRMIRRFVADALQRPDVPQQLAADLVKAVADRSPKVPLRALDHAIWSYQRSIRAAQTTTLPKRSAAARHRG